MAPKKGILAVPGVSASNPSGGGSQYFGAAGAGAGPGNPFGDAPPTGTPMDWNSGIAPSVTDVNGAIVPIYGKSGDTFGLGQAFPAGAGVGGGLLTPQVEQAPKDIEYYTASVAKMSVSDQQTLGSMLADAGVISPSKTGYKTSTIQSGFRTALERTSEAGAPSLTDYLGSQISQRQQAGLPGSTATAAQTAGAEAAQVSDLQTVADNYQIPMSTQALQSFANGYVTSGLNSTEATAEFKAYAQNIAAGLYPTLAPQITKGIDTKTLLTPYAQLAASQVGVDPNTINWSDPKWSKAVNGGVDPATGRPAPMALDQWGQTMRADPTYGWQNTDAAHSAAASFAASIAKTFGALGSDTISTSATPGSGA